MTEAVLKIENLSTRIGSQSIHKNLSLEVNRGEILGLVGASGSGKTVLVRVILGLMPYQSGRIEIFGRNSADPRSALEIRRRMGVLFQSGALFSSLSIGDNIRLPMFEIAKIPPHLADELMQLKLSLVGLPSDTAFKFPEELSGGMIKRAALARALAVDAELLFLDEPTSGLDPISAERFDNLLKTLQRNLNLTVVMVTHDPDSLQALCDRIAVLVDHQLIIGTVEELRRHDHPWIREYFRGRRGPAHGGEA